MEGYEGYRIHTLVSKTEMPYYDREHFLNYEEIGLLPNNWRFPSDKNLLSKYNYLPELRNGMSKDDVINLLSNYHMDINKENTTVYDNNRKKILLQLDNTSDQSPREDNRPRPFAQRIGGMKNQEVKKCEKKKVVLGKERCIYKVSGSKKDYMKYKGKLVPVTDYVKYMKKKN